MVDEFCAHRRSSLFLGRNEESGLRCVYHGWKYDVDGNCVDMPNEPPATDFKNKIHLKSYPTVELGGVIWTYMGPKEQRPALPKFEWTEVPAEHRLVSKTWQECNWLQALEGGLRRRARFVSPLGGRPQDSPSGNAAVLDRVQEPRR